MFQPCVTFPEPARVTGCHAGDLLGDVLAHAEPGDVLLTVTARRTTIAVAIARHLSAVVLTEGHAVPEAMRAGAEEAGIPLFTTPLTTYEAAKALADAGL